MEEKNMGQWKYIGKIAHFFEHPCAGIVELTDGNLQIADNIRIKGYTTDIEQEVSSLKDGKNAVDAAQIGQSIGIKVKERVRINDKVYKLVKNL